MTAQVFSCLSTFTAYFVLVNVNDWGLQGASNTTHIGRVPETFIQNRSGCNQLTLRNRDVIAAQTEDVAARAFGSAPSGHDIYRTESCGKLSESPG